MINTENQGKGLIISKKNLVFYTEEFINAIDKLNEIEGGKAI